MWLPREIREMIIDYSDKYNIHEAKQRINIIIKSENYYFEQLRDIIFRFEIGPDNKEFDAYIRLKFKRSIRLIKWWEKTGRIMYPPY